MTVQIDVSKPFDENGEPLGSAATPFAAKLAAVIVTRLGDAAMAAKEEDDDSKPRRMLKLEQVLRIVPFGHTTLKRMVRAKSFPQPKYISPNRRIWYEDEIVAWQKDVVDASEPRRRRRGKRAQAE